MRTLSLIFSFFTVLVKAQTISTFAGTGVAGFSGNGGPATTAQLSGPRTIVFDASGNAYFSDFFNHRIRKINSSGVISTFAGTGLNSYGGDGGLAINAQISTVNGIALDNVGNMYFTDAVNLRIRKIDFTGVISTFAGNGTQGLTGDGGPAFAAQLYQPIGITADQAGNIYFSEGAGHKVRKINTAGNISTVAGSGAQGFSGDGGAATAATLNYPYGLAIDVYGNLYIADNGNNRIRKITPQGIISTVAGNGNAGFGGDGGPALSASLYGPSEMTFDASDNMYIADYFNHRVRKMYPNGNITTVAGTGVAGYNGDGGLAVNAKLNIAAGVALDPGGNLYIPDWFNERIRRVSCLQPTVVATTSPSLICAGDSIIINANGAITYSWSTGANSNSIIVSPSSSSTFTLQGIDDGCFSSPIAVSVSVATLPNINVSSSSTLSCFSGTAILTAIGASTYTWSGGVTNGVPFTFNAPSSYTVFGTDLNGCVNSGSVNLVIPQPSVTASSSLLCVGETGTLTVTGASSYVWNTGNVSSSIVITPIVTTVYSVIATTSAGCVYTVSIAANVDNCTDIDKMALSELIQPTIFPNPFMDRITISVDSKLSRPLELKILDMFGKIVYTTQVELEKTEINLSFLDKGVWFLEIDSNSNTVKVKLLKN